jgi:hypothetical protein
VTKKCCWLFWSEVFLFSVGTSFWPTASCCTLPNPINSQSRSKSRPPIPSPRSTAGGFRHMLHVKPPPLAPAPNSAPSCRQEEPHQNVSLIFYLALTITSSWIVLEQDALVPPWLSGHMTSFSFSLRIFPGRNPLFVPAHGLFMRDFRY